jgi:hypothetical protein
MYARRFRRLQAPPLHVDTFWLRAYERVSNMVAKFIEDALDAFRFAAVARRSNRVTAAQIQKLLGRRES